jgi:hypothetical protein
MGGAGRKEKDETYSLYGQFGNVERVEFWKGKKSKI